LELAEKENNEPLFCGMKSLSFVVLGEPRGQQRPKFSTHNGMVKARDPKESVEMKQTIQGIVNNICLKQDWKLCAVDMPVSIEFKVFKAYPGGKPTWYKRAADYGLIVPTKKPDFDNIIKLYCDALTGVVYADDRQVFECHYTTRFSAQPRVEVTVKAYFINVGDVKECTSRLAKEGKRDG
jgi:Holliday junction resolvase RusA-like endonuclease